MAHSSQDIRNLALIGHGNSGKTAIVDALAFHTKAINRQGDSADGTSISNNEPEEKERKQTLTSHLFGLQADKIRLNLIDTPGHTDFAADAISAMPAVETAVLCISASGGVPFHARRLWMYAGEAGIGRAIVVTHLDAESTDFEQTLSDLQEAFGDGVAAVTYPDKSGGGISEAHNVLAGEGPDASSYRERLDEQVALVDDGLVEQYLENGGLDDKQLEANLSKAIVQGKLVPVFAVCAPNKIGLQPFCDIVRDHFPSPLAFGPRNAGEPGSGSFGDLVEADPEQPFAAKVFKVVADPYVGRMSYLRCFRGTLKPEQSVVDVRSGKNHKIGGLLEVVGKETKNLDQVVPGDLFAVSKIEEMSLNDSVTTNSAKIEFPPPDYPSPTYSLAVTPKSRGDEQKIGQGLEKLCAEDPTLKHGRNAETGELVVSGMSPLHLEIQFARLLRRYSVGVESHAPTIPYRETITSKAEGHHRHKKQTGGRGQFAEVYLRVAPKASGEGFEFIDSVVGGSIPRQFIPEVEKGIRRFLTKGGLAGFPVVDASAEVYDGKYHDVDSDQISFQLAGERAFADGYHKAKPILLEPIMNVEIHVPERFTGDVAGNLSSSRGRMQGMEVVEGIQVIKAQVPLAEMQDYSTHLRSITAGEGTFSMAHSHYEAVPANLQQEIVARRKKAEEEK